VPELIPKPSPNDIPLNHPTQVTLDPGEQATLRYEPKQNVTAFKLPVVAVSKYRESTYRVKLDGEVVYPETGIPPTDIDDLTPVFVPAYSFSQYLEIRIKNVSESTRTYHVQPLGWEVSDAS